MKLTSLLVAAALSLATASAYSQTAKSSPAAGGSASPSTPPTIASAIDREISLVEKEVVEAAEAMPEDKFDFSPEKLNIPGSEYKGVRTFGEQLKHIAASNYLIWSPITGEKPPDTVNDGKGPDNMKAKAEIIKFVKDSFALRPQIGRHPEQLEPRRTDYLEKWQDDHASFPGNICRSSLLRSLRPDDRVSPDERDCPTSEPRAIAERIKIARRALL
jgi:hypothetical protein